MTSSVGASRAVEAIHLTYKFRNGSEGLSDVSLSLPKGSRTLLTGANGAGKSTLLQVLAGKRMAPNGTVRVAGVDPFKDSLEGVTYLGTEWVLNPVVRRDIDVRCLLASVGGDYYPDRRDELVAILDIDLEWHMHEVSDGERRRVQLAMGLMRPWQVLLLDEVTVDLDLLARTRFLKFLKDESDARSCTIVYATHIFDLMNEWPTHLVHMTLGQVRHFGGFEELLNKHAARSEGLGSARIANLVLEWLSYDFEVRGPRKTLPKQ